MTKAQRDEVNAQITSLAARRITWEAARDSVYMRAQQSFIRRQDALAEAFRELGAEFEANRKTASDEQQRLLDLLHPELKR